MIGKENITISPCGLKKYDAMDTLYIIFDETVN